MLAYHQKVWGVLFLGWMSLYMVRIGLSPLLVPIMDEFHLSYAQAGLLSTAVFWAYTLMQIPSGYLGDRWGHRKLLVVGTFGWTLLSFFTSLVSTFAALLAVRFFTGMAQGTYFGNDRPLVAHYTPQEEMARGQGFSAMGMGLGMGLGILLAGPIAGLWGWRWVFACYSLPSLLAFVLVYKVIREPPREIDQGSAPATKLSAHIATPRLIFLYLSYFATMYLFWVLGTWAPTIFMEQGMGGIGSSSAYASVLGFISIPSMLISGIISDRLGKGERGRFGTLIVSLFIMICLSVCMGLSLQFQAEPIWLGLLYLGAGAAAWGFFPPFYALIAGSVRSSRLGMTFGTANTVAFMSSLAAPWLTGLIRDMTRGFSWGLYASGAILVGGLVTAWLASRTSMPATI
jgi:MFS family permease